MDNLITVIKGKHHIPEAIGKLKGKYRIDGDTVFFELKEDMEDFYLRLRKLRGEKIHEKRFGAFMFGGGYERGNNG